MIPVYQANLTSFMGIECASLVIFSGGKQATTAHTLLLCTFICWVDPLGIINSQSSKRYNPLYLYLLECHIPIPLGNNFPGSYMLLMRLQ